MESILKILICFVFILCLSDLCFFLSNIRYSCFVCCERERALVRSSSLPLFSLSLSVHSVVFKMLLVGASDGCQQASQDHQRQEQDPDGGCHHQCQLRWSRQMQTGLLLTRWTLLARWSHPALDRSTWTLKNHSISGSFSLYILGEKYSKVLLNASFSTIFIVYDDFMQI